MGLGSIYTKMALISPYIEIGLRKLYWRNVDRLKRFSPHKAKSSLEAKDASPADFEKIIGWLKDRGIGEGDLLIVHSGYGQLERTGLSPEEIIDRLLTFIGPQGTLAMPVIRRYKEVEKVKKEGNDWKKIVGKYNVKKTMVTSGLLPYTLMQREDAVISHHPFNPMCAVGPLAKEMMEHNLDGYAPSPHGPNSSWRFCYDHGAKVCSIGTDIEHHNTISHIVEESFDCWYWPDDVWYDYLKYIVVDENKNEKEIIVRNRKEEWGKKHLAEINSTFDGKKAGIMCSNIIEGISIGFVDPHKMVSFLQSKNKKGYPYFVFPWENVKKIK